VAAALAVPLWEDLQARGAKACGLGARDTLRLEAAMPLYGHELSEEIDPLQAGLSWAVKMDKGDFVGRAALQRRQHDHNLPIRVGLEVQGKRLAREGADIKNQGECVGRVCSGTFAPTLQKAIAMAYVVRKVAMPGTALEIDIRGKVEAARVVPLPFYKRRRN
jgi:aminomethyltransferase